MRPSGSALPVLLLLAVALACGARPALAATPDSTLGTTPIAPTTPRPAEPRELYSYYGGSFALGYWDGDARFAIMPNVAWGLTPKLSLGVGGSYEFVSYDSGEGTAHNYGGSVFARYRFTPAFYGRSEFEARSLDAVSTPVGLGRQTVEFFWLGGGVVTPLGRRTSAYAEVLLDLVQDPLSPYEGGRPLTRIGVNFAF